jgi:hypothetical protein
MKKMPIAVADPVVDAEAAEKEQKRLYELRLARIQALGTSLAGKRLEAVDARRTSGIEEDWLEDEEHYEGIDDANREFHRNATKPTSPEGGSDKTKDTAVRSRVFLNITRPYVDAAAAKVADMLLPTDDQNWGIDPTPIPSLTRNKGNADPLVTPEGKPMMVAGPDGQQKQMTVADHVAQIMAQAKDAAEQAETRIDDWLTECNYNHETRKVIEKCARLGTGIIKGPVPVARSYTSLSKANGLASMIKQIKLNPASRAIDPWDLYPDPSCGNDIHSGSYVFERDRLTKRKVEELLDDESYIPEMVQKCLTEGPQNKMHDDKSSERNGLVTGENAQYDVWYFTGYVEREDLEAAGCPCDEDQSSIPAVIVMINNHVVKAAINPLDSGEFPYDVMTWQERDGHWAGIGVARQIRTPQRILNSGIRNVMDNAGLMSGPQIVMKRSMIEPADGNWAITPRKLWYMLEDAVGTVNEAFAAINIPAMQEQLFSIIQYAQKMAEDVTGLPALLQGQQGAAPETVGGMQMLNNNASTVMRRIARTYDDKITEPHIRRYYEWLLLDPDVPESEKGDFKIVARGSSALVERDIQNQTIGQMGAMVVNPAFGIDPKRWVAEYFKSQRLDPKNFQYTAEELKAQADAAAQNPPQDPRQITAQANIEAAKIRTEGMVQVKNAEVAERTNERQLDIEDAREERASRERIAQLQFDMKVMELADKRNLSIQQVKAQLATVAIVEKNKRDLQRNEIEVKSNLGSGL